MTATHIGHLAEHSEEWHVARRYRVGGSDVGVIMGWSMWDTPESLAAKKLLGERSETTPRQQLGHDAEPMLAAWLARKLGYPIDTEPGTWADDVGVANPDAIVEGDPSLGETPKVIAEFKTVNDRATELGWGRAGTDQIPLTYAAQIQWYMGMTGASLCHLVALAGATNGRIGLHVAHYKIAADPAVFAHLYTAAAEWLHTHLNERQAS